MGFKLQKRSVTRAAEADAFSKNKFAQQAEEAAQLDPVKAPRSFSNLFGLKARTKPAPATHVPVVPTPHALAGMEKTSDRLKRYLGMDEKARTRNGFGWHQTAAALSPIQLTICSAKPKLFNATRVEGYQQPPIPEAILRQINRTPARRKEQERQRFRTAINDQVRLGVDIDAMAEREAEKVARAVQDDMKKYGVPDDKSPKSVHREASESEIAGALHQAQEALWADHRSRVAAHEQKLRDLAFGMAKASSMGWNVATMNIKSPLAPEPPTPEELAAVGQRAADQLKASGVNARPATPEELEDAYRLALVSPAATAASDRVYSAVDRSVLASLNGANTERENVLTANRRRGEYVRLIQSDLFKGSTPTDRMRLEQSIKRLQRQAKLDNEDCVTLVKTLAAVYGRHAEEPTPASRAAASALAALGGRVPLSRMNSDATTMTFGSSRSRHSIAPSFASSTATTVETPGFHPAWDFEDRPGHATGSFMDLGSDLSSDTARFLSGRSEPVRTSSPEAVARTGSKGGADLDPIEPAPGAMSSAAMALLALNELKSIDLVRDVHDFGDASRPAGTHAAGWRLAHTLNNLPGMGTDLLNRISNQPAHGEPPETRTPLTDRQLSNLSAYLHAADAIAGDGPIDPASIYQDAGLVEVMEIADEQQHAREFSDAIATGRKAPPASRPAIWPGRHGTDIQLPDDRRLDVPRAALLALHDAELEGKGNGFRWAIPMASGNMLTDDYRDEKGKLTEFGFVETRAGKNLGAHIERARRRGDGSRSWIRRTGDAVFQKNKSWAYAWDDIVAKKPRDTLRNRMQAAGHRVTHTGLNPEGMGLELVHRSGVHEGRSSKRMIEEVEKGLMFPYRSPEELAGQKEPRGILVPHPGGPVRVSLEAGQTVPAHIVMHAQGDAATKVNRLAKARNDAHAVAAQAQRELARARERFESSPPHLRSDRRQELNEALDDASRAEEELRRAEAMLSAHKKALPNSLLTRDIVRVAMLRAAYAEMNPLPAFTRAADSSDQQVLAQVRKMISGMKPGSREENVFLDVIRTENREFPGDPDSPAARPHPQRMRRWAEELLDPAPAAGARPLPHNPGVTADARPEEVHARTLLPGQPNWVRFEQGEHRAIHNEIPEGPFRIRREGEPEQPQTYESFKGKTREEIADMITDMARGLEHSGITLKNGGWVHGSSRAATALTSALTSVGTLTFRVDAGYGRKREVTFECGLNMDGAKVRVGVSTFQQKAQAGGGASIGLDLPDVDFAKFGAGADGQVMWEKTESEGAVFGIPRPDRIAKDDILWGRMADMIRLLIHVAAGPEQARNYEQKGIERPANPRDRESLTKSVYQAFPDASVGRYSLRQDDLKVTGGVSGGFGLSFGKFKLGIPSLGTSGQFIKGRMTYKEHSGPIRVNKQMFTTRFEATAAGTMATLSGILPVGDKTVPAPGAAGVGETVNPASVQLAAAAEVAGSVRYYQWGHTDTNSSIEINNRETPTSWAINQNHNHGSFANYIAENLPRLAQERASVKVPDPTRSSPAFLARAAKEELILGEFEGETLDVADKASLPQTLTEWTAQNRALNQLRAEVKLAEMMKDTRRMKQAQKQIDKIHNCPVYKEMRSIREVKKKEITNRLGPNAWMGFSHQDDSTATEHSTRFV